MICFDRDELSDGQQGEVRIASGGHYKPELHIQHQVCNNFDTRHRNSESEWASILMPDAHLGLNVVPLPGLVHSTFLDRSLIQRSSPVNMLGYTGKEQVFVESCFTIKVLQYFIHL